MLPWIRGRPKRSCASTTGIAKPHCYRNMKPLLELVVIFVAGLP